MKLYLIGAGLIVILSLLSYSQYQRAEKFKVAASVAIQAANHNAAEVERLKNEHAKNDAIAEERAREAEAARVEAEGKLRRFRNENRNDPWRFVCVPDYVDRLLGLDRSQGSGEGQTPCGPTH